VNNKKTRRAPEYMRLRPDYVRRLEEIKGIRTRFFAFLKKHEIQIEEDRWRTWMPLKTGQPVRRELCEVLIEFLRKECKQDNVVVDAAFESCLPDFTKQIGVWINMRRALSSIKSYRPRENMSCVNAKDIADAAKTIILATGEKNAKPNEVLDQAISFQRGEQDIKTTFRDYCKWLKRMSGREPRSVMFPVVSRKSKRCGTTQRRCGVSVVFSLTEDAYTRILKGEISDLSLSPDDLLPRSQYLFIEAVSPSFEIRKLKQNARTSAEVKCLMFQLAYFTRGMSKLRPKILTLISNPGYQQLLFGLGFQHTGTCLYDSTYPLVQLAPPLEFGKRSMKYWLNYFDFLHGLRSFQMANRKAFNLGDSDSN